MCMIASIFLGTGFLNIHSISVNNILLPSSAGNGNRFITAKFAEIIATTYRNESKPSADTFAMVMIVVIVPPAPSMPILPVINAPSDAKILNTMKKQKLHALPKARKNGSFALAIVRVMPKP